MIIFSALCDVMSVVGVMRPCHIYQKWISQEGKGWFGIAKFDLKTVDYLRGIKYVYFTFTFTIAWILVDRHSKSIDVLDPIRRHSSSSCFQKSSQTSSIPACLS